jgi:hypothetical protein
LVEHNQFTVDHERSCGHVIQGTGDVLVLGRNAVTAGRKEARRAAVPDGQGPEAVVLDLKKPVVAVVRACGPSFTIWSAKLKGLSAARKS